MWIKRHFGELFWFVQVGSGSSGFQTFLERGQDVYAGGGGWLRRSSGFLAGNELLEVLTPSVAELLRLEGDHHSLDQTFREIELTLLCRMSLSPEFLVAPNF